MVYNFFLPRASSEIDIFLDSSYSDLFMVKISSPKPLGQKRAKFQWKYDIPIAMNLLQGKINDKSY